MMLSLMEAISQDKLGEFIDQQEASGYGPIREAEFDALANKVIRSERSADQTSGSPRRDGLPGK